MKTTGPVLAIGAITLANQSVINGRPLSVRVAVGTGLAAGAFALAEKAWERPAVALAYLALVATLFVRVGSVPAPVESFNRWWSGGR